MTNMKHKLSDMIAGSEYDEIQVTDLIDLSVYIADLESELFNLKEGLEARVAVAELRSRNANAEVATRLEEACEVLRSLASYVGNGGYNAPDPIDLHEFELKIREGLDSEMAFWSKHYKQALIPLLQEQIADWRGYTDSDLFSSSKIACDTLEMCARELEELITNLDK